MKTIVLLALLLCAASAAPAEDKLTAPEVEDKMKNQEELVPEDSVPVPMDAQVVAQEAAPEEAAPFSFCPSGWFSHDGHCFLFVNNPLTWYRAEEHCNDLGGNLASVTNGRQYSFLQMITQTAGQSVVWLGGFNLQGQWLWIDRERFYYNNWYSQSSATSYPCITLRSTTGWANVQCTSTYRFICGKSQFRC